MIGCHIAQPLRSLVHRRLQASGGSSFGDDLYPESVQRFDRDELTGTRDHGNFVDAYFGHKNGFPPPNFLSERLKLTGVLPGEDSELSYSNPIWRVDYVQRQFGYFAVFPMISQRAINESLATAALLNTRVDLDAFRGGGPCDSAKDADKVRQQHRQESYRQEPTTLPYYGKTFFREAHKYSLSEQKPGLLL